MSPLAVTLLAYLLAGGLPRLTPGVDTAMVLRLGGGGPTGRFIHG